MSEKTQSKRLLAPLHRRISSVLATNALAFSFLTILLAAFSSTQAQRVPYSQEDEELYTEMRRVYNMIRNPEITFEQFAVNAIGSFRDSRRSHQHSAREGENTLAVQDTYCNKVAAYCTYGDFEGVTTTTQLNTAYTGAYGIWYNSLYPDPYAMNGGHTYGFSSGVYNSSAARQTIVTAGVDPVVAGLNRVHTNGGTQSLRLGNAVTGNGAEIIAKTLTVDPTETILKFYYAVVFQDPGHVYAEQPAFSVRVYDCANGLEITGVCNLGNGGNIAVSDASNPFFQSASGGSIAWRNWSQAQIDLSAHVGKKVIVVFTNKDCDLGGHYGYTYLDNLFSSQCPVVGEEVPGDGNINFAANRVDTCGTGNICIKYSLPFVTRSGVTTTGTTTISLKVYQNNTLVTTLSSGAISTYNADSVYCFSINPATLGINTSLGGFDYAVDGSFVLAGFTLAPKTLGNPPQGVKVGLNNDYLVVCPSPLGPIYYSKPTGDLHNVLTWGLNPDGSGPTPSDFNDSTFQLANRPGVYTMTGNWIINGGTLSNLAGNVLQINGYSFTGTQFIGAGTISGSMTSNMSVIGSAGGDAGTINFTPAANMLNNFTLNRTGTSASATLSNALNVHGVLTVTNGTFATATNLTLKSTATNTARFAPINTSVATVTGDVTVERYIPARRAWRIMGAPTGGSQTINAAWQEGTTNAGVVNPNPGYGTFITQGGAAQGLDYNPVTAMASIKWYNPAVNNWVVQSSTNATAVNSQAFMLFVRGHRGANLGYNTEPATITTLRTKGPLRMGDQVFPVATSGFTAIPNPYPSPINFATLTRTNVGANFYLWDPKMGGVNGVGAYVLMSYNGSGWDQVPAAISPESQYIQSGQGFLVSATAAGAQVTVKESDKSATAAMDVFRTTAGGATTLTTNTDSRTQGFRISLNTVEGNGSVLLDELYTSYNGSYADAVDGMDAAKLPNIGENLAVVNEGKELMLERRTLNPMGATVALKMWNMEQKEYELEINPSGLASMGLNAYLEDAFLQTRTAISLEGTTKVKFSVSSVAGSSIANRFRLVFVSEKQMPTVTSAETVSVYPNPITDQTIRVQFNNQPKGLYQVQLMNSNGQVVYRGQLNHAGGTSVQSLTVGNRLVKGSYQLVVTGANGSKTVTVLK